MPIESFKQYKKAPTLHSAFTKRGKDATDAYKTLQENAERFDILLDSAMKEFYEVRKRRERNKKLAPPRTYAAILRHDKIKAALLTEMKLAVRQAELFVELMIVLMVTFTETYLQDVLAAAAAANPRFMEESEQKLSYEELGSFSAIAEAEEELRARWARNFVDKGGPALCASRITKMGATGLPKDSPEVMEEAWGVRHMIVHRASRTTREFCKRHPKLCNKPGEVLKLDPTLFTDYMTAVAVFCAAADDFFLGLIEAGKKREAERDVQRAVQAVGEALQSMPEPEGAGG